MHQALTSPIFRSIAVGGVLLALSLSQLGAAKRHPRHMVLHAVAEPDAVYLTAWRHGNVPVPFEGDKLIPLTYRTLASVNDGCRWLATETLVPVEATRYFYRYDETILDCDPGATPCRKTPRTGYVTVEP
jgi:hypothetical protein